jgi:hypothetical protein
MDKLVYASLIMSHPNTHTSSFFSSLVNLKTIRNSFDHFDRKRRRKRGGEKKLLDVLVALTRRKM